MALTVRQAEAANLEAIAALTRDHRHQLAAWAPLWWAPAPGADELHPLWLARVVEQGHFRVVVSGRDTDAVVACAAMVPQGPQWFLDDVAVDDEARWPEVAPVLFEACGERPAVACIAAADGRRRDAFLAAGSTPVSSYWVGMPVAGPFEPVEPDAVVPSDPPRHTFGGMPFDPTGPYSLRAAAPGGAGFASGSPSFPPPPIYTAGGGLVAIVDRIVGPDVRAAVVAASGAAAARGDVRLCVVCGADDADLADALAGAGLERTVDVHSLP